MRHRPSATRPCAATGPNHTPGVERRRSRFTPSVPIRPRAAPPPTPALDAAANDYRFRTRITQFQATSSRSPGTFITGLAHGQ
jgi:hypothetical protein